MMNFGDALAAAKDGKAVQRAGWNGKGMYVYLTHAEGFEPALVLFTAQGKHQIGWLASQSDMLAEDWSIVTP